MDRTTVPLYLKADQKQGLLFVGTSAVPAIPALLDAVISGYTYTHFA
jgi:hypothetical protein